MSQPTQYNTQPQQPLHMPVNAPVPTKPKSKRKWLLPVLVAVALLFGFGIGSVSNPAPPPVETIKEIEKPVRVEVPVVPPECAEAFTHAETAFSSAGRTSDIFKDAIDAVYQRDVPAIEAQTVKIKAENEVVTGVAPKYVAAKTACLAG